MSTKLNTLIINPEFENLFTFKNKDEKLEHKAQIISYTILSEVEKLCQEKKIKKKDLALMIGTSKSYITQLFRGTKHVNTLTMAKFEEALNITFEVKAKLCEDSYDHFLSKQITNEVLHRKKVTGKEGTWYYCRNTKDRDQKATREFITELKTKDIALQKVV